MHRIFFFFSILLANIVYADSPLTSTDLTEGYEKDEMVQYAKASGGNLDDQLLEFLLDDKNPLHRRLVVINAVGWESGSSESRTYDLLGALSKQLSIELDMLLSYDTERLNTIVSSEIYLCLAYIAAMENHLESPDFLFEYLEIACQDKKIQKSFTAMAVIGLIRAQHFMDYDWCLVYEQTDILRQHKRNFKMDLSKKAYQNIYEYMDLYAEYCDNEMDFED